MTEITSGSNDGSLSKADVLAFYAHITQSLSQSIRLNDAVKSYFDAAPDAQRAALSLAELESLASHLLGEVLSQKDIHDVAGAYLESRANQAVSPAAAGGEHSNGNGGGSSPLLEGSSDDTQRKAVELLNAIPFGVLLGGPLTAAVDAQTRSSMATLNFIMTALYGKKYVDGGLDVDASKLGLGGGSEEILYVKFTYETDAGLSTIQVPLLTILPISYLQVDNLDIDFVAKIAAVTTDNSRKDDETKWNGNTSASTWWGRFNIDTGITTDVTSHSDSTSATNANYEMNVRLRASQGEMPGGMARVLDLLEDGVRAKTAPKSLLQIYKPSADGYTAATLTGSGLQVLYVPDDKTLALVANGFNKTSATAADCLIAAAPDSGLFYKFSSTATGSLKLEAGKSYKLMLTDGKATNDSYTLEPTSLTIKVKS